MLHSFHKPLLEVPIVWIDTETTGVVPGVDAVVQLCRGSHHGRTDR